MQMTSHTLIFPNFSAITILGRRFYYSFNLYEIFIFRFYVPVDSAGLEKKGRMEKQIHNKLLMELRSYRNLLLLIVRCSKMVEFGWEDSEEYKNLLTKIIRRRVFTKFYFHLMVFILPLVLAGYRFSDFNKLVYRRWHQHRQQHHTYCTNIALYPTHRQQTALSVGVAGRPLVYDRIFIYLLRFLSPSFFFCPHPQKHTFFALDQHFLTFSSTAAISRAKTLCNLLCELKWWRRGEKPNATNNA